MSISISKLKLFANNSSGHQTLDIRIPDKDSQHEDEVWCYLNGQYEGENIQIDFEEIEKDQFICFLENTLRTLKRCK